jgi:hypothetical protein
MNEHLAVDLPVLDRKMSWGQLESSMVELGRSLRQDGL